jgi:hypothetical protein
VDVDVDDDTLVSTVTLGNEVDNGFFALKPAQYCD